MAEKSSFFNARLNGTTYDRVYKAEDFANYFSTFIGNGVFANPTNNLQVVANSGMTVTLKSGKAFINGYFYENTEDLEITIDSADGTLKRIDRIVLRLDYLNREIKAYVLKGTPSSSAVSQDITRNSDMYEIALCSVAVNPGVTEITQSNLNDTRYSDSICGIVKGLVDEIDTNGLFAQYEDMFMRLKESERNQFNVWFNELKSQLDTNQATNLQNQLNKIHNDDLFIISNFMTNGNFKTTDNWIATRGTLTASNNVGVFTTDTSNGSHYIRQPNLNINFKQGDKIFINFDLVSNTETYKPRLALYENVDSSLTLKLAKDFETSTVNERMIYNISADTNGFQIVFYLNDVVNSTTGFTGTGAETLKVSNVICINLTEVFGKGNEPTVEEMDRIMTYYNGFIDDKNHLLDRNSKVNTQFRENGGTINGETRFRGNIEVYNGNLIRSNRVINNEIIDVGQGYMRVGSAGQAVFGCSSENGNVNDFGLVLEYANNKKAIRPLEKNTHELGTENYRFKDLYLSNGAIKNVGDAFCMEGNAGKSIILTAKNSDSSIIGDLFLYVDSNGNISFRPTSTTGTNKIQLGNTSYKFKDVWVGAFTRQTPGYTTLTNGLILQWGMVTYTNEKRLSGNEYWTFPIAFPNNCLFVTSNLASQDSNGNAKSNSIYAEKLSGDNAKTQFHIRWIADSTTTKSTVQWFAIGY